MATGVDRRGAAERERVRFEGPAALGRLAELGWDDLVLARWAPDPTRTTGWLRAATGQPEQASMCAHGLVRAGQLAAGILLSRSRRMGLSILGDFGRMGTWFDLTPPAEDAAARAELLEGLADERGDLLVLSGVDVGSTYERSLRATFPDALLEPMSYAYRLTFERPPKRLKERERAGRTAFRRAAEGGEPLTVDWITRWSDIREVLDPVLDLHRASFQGPEAENELSAPPGRERTQRVLAAAGAARRVRIALISRGRRIVSFNIALVEGANAVGFATGFDRGEDVPQLGWASFVELFEGLKSEGVETLDVGLGAFDSYKYRIADRIERRRAVVPLSRLGRLAVAARRLRVRSGR